MIALNLTLFIVLGMFLGFLWLMSAYVFKPLLQVMDNREHQLEEDAHTTQEEKEKAETLETEYARKITAIHREASHTVYHARRAAQDAHNEKVKALKRQEEQEVAQVRAQAMEQIEQERKEYPELVHALQQQIAQQLHIEGKSA